MTSKNAERMLKTLYTSMMKVNENRERRTHAINILIQVIDKSG